MIPISEQLETLNNSDQIIKRMNGVHILSSFESSFSIIGVRCCSDKSVGRRKLIPNKIYYLLDGYDLENESGISKRRKSLEHLYDDYLISDVIGKPHIQISAIVGQNGSGKSSLVEFIMRLINNFAACTFGESKLGPAADRLHYIYGVEGDLWYEVDGFLHELHVDDNHVSLSIISRDIQPKRLKSVRVAP